MNIKDKIRTDRLFLLKIFVFLFFVFTMVYNINHSAIWGDEWVEFNYSRKGILNAELFRYVGSTFQPPLYNVVMHFWLMVSDNVLWFRLFNLIPGTISGILLYKSVSKLWNNVAACISLFALACSYHWVFVIQECSEYALMLMFLFLALYFYIELYSGFKKWYFMGFVISLVLALYTQYGSFFVAVPLLAIYFFKNVSDRNLPSKIKRFIILFYVLCGVVLGLPLVLVYVRLQFKNNEIGHYWGLKSISLLRDFPSVIGRVIMYFYGSDQTILVKIIGLIITILLMTLTALVIYKKNLNFLDLSLIITFWSSYIIHFILGKLQIYGMMHPNENMGFYNRYSYFYIPLLFVVIPVIIRNLIRSYPVLNKKGITIVAGLAALSLMVFSLINLLPNWHKSKDDLYAQIWLNNRGWEDRTFLFGIANYGFNYYVSQSDGFEEKYLYNATTNPTYLILPERFWAWRTNWDGEGWQTFVDEAYKQGYTVTIYDDSDFEGQLAFCYK